MIENEIRQFVHEFAKLRDIQLVNFIPIRFIGNKLWNLKNASPQFLFSKKR